MSRGTQERFARWSAIRDALARRGDNVERARRLIQLYNLRSHILARSQFKWY